MTQTITTVAQLVHDTLSHALNHNEWISQAIHTLSLEETICAAMAEVCREKGLAVEAWEVSVLEHGSSASVKNFQAVEVEGVWIALTPDVSSGIKMAAFESLRDLKSACLVLVESQYSSGLVCVTRMRRLAFDRAAHGGISFSGICYRELIQEIAEPWARHSAQKLDSSWPNPASSASPKPRM